MFLVYFAGELFSLKHLVGNAALAEAIANISNRHFTCVLPQAMEERYMSAQDIRDKDLFMLIGCDLALFNFDGPELDSGTVAEFMFAKFADIPSLLLRTDFRRAGDHAEEPWNLMMSFYPRTRTLCLNSMEIYKDAGNRVTDSMGASQYLVEQVAQTVVKELELLCELTPTIPSELSEPIYRWLSKMPGFHSPDSDAKMMAALERKKARRLVF